MKLLNMGRHIKYILGRNVFLQCVLTWSALNPCKAIKKQRKTFERCALAHFNKDMLSMVSTLLQSLWMLLFGAATCFSSSCTLPVSLASFFSKEGSQSSRTTTTQTGFGFYFSLIVGFQIFTVVKRLFCCDLVYLVVQRRLLFKVSQDTFGLLLLV